MVEGGDVGRVCGGVWRVCGEGVESVWRGCGGNVEGVISVNDKIFVKREMHVNGMFEDNRMSLNECNHYLVSNVYRELATLVIIPVCIGAILVSEVRLSCILVSC